MTESAAWNAVVEYFRLFRDGFKPSVPVSELCRNRAALCVDQAHTQAQFFQATLAPDVLSNAGYGLETALEDWRQVSMHHEDLTIELVQMRRGADNSVVAFMDGVTTITAGMLQNALPAFGGETNWESISARLIGQQILVPATVHFQWDNTTRRITSLCYVSDMLTPLLKLLGNLEDASRVLGTALDIQYWSKKISRQ